MADAVGHAVCLDIGGTSVKAAVVREDSLIVEGSATVDPVDSRGSAEGILAAFAGAARRALDRARAGGLAVRGMGVSICGPFDYAAGISRIRGLDKYEALYGLNVKEDLRRRLGLSSGFPILFEIDAWSFARGEVWSGAGRGYDRVIVFTMGTGVGSAFAVRGRIVGEGPGVPWLGWISGQPHGEGILNDGISRTWMMRRYAELTGGSLDVSEMAARARTGDADARRVFAEVGETLASFLRDHNLRDFQAECIVFGGRISRSFELFAGPVKALMREVPCLRAVLPAADIEGSALKGAGRFVFETIGA